jgi:hypothetical protein
MFRIGASWKTVRSNGGLALPVFVRTLQPKVHPRHDVSRQPAHTPGVFQPYSCLAERNPTSPDASDFPDHRVFHPLIRFASFENPAAEILNEFTTDIHDARIGLTFATRHGRQIPFDY